LSATEKEALDAWYICNASPSLDLRIIGMTLLSLLRGDRRSHKALAQAQRLHAQHLQALQGGRDKRGSKPAVSSRFAITADRLPRDDAREAAAMESR
jgi:hypothetical protein